jgi:hypothetical protein
MEESILRKRNVVMVYNNIVFVNNLHLINEMEIGGINIILSMSSDILRVSLEISLLIRMRKQARLKGEELLLIN